jgi:hypothetical protein
MNQSAEQIVNAQRYISSLVEQVTAQYQSTGEERASINTWEANKEYSVLGILELCSTYTLGAASQIVHKGYVTDVDEVVTLLCKYNFFNFSYCLAWFLEHSHLFPKITSYTESITYLRFTVLEYVRFYQTS